jgi:hypothetical protein
MPIPEQSNVCLSTKKVPLLETYAQKSCCGAAKEQFHQSSRYKSNSDCKLLIHKGSV